MKIKYLFLGFVALAVSGSLAFLSQKGEIAQKYQARTQHFYEGKDVGGFFGAYYWIMARKINPATGTISLEELNLAKKQVAKIRANGTKSDVNWIEMGPDNVGGRTRTILIDKTEPNIILAGSVSGGIWRSTTHGLSWQKVSYAGDNSSTGINSSDIIANLCVSSFCQAANGDIYFGTGEYFYNPHGGITGGFWGQGIWKSTDKGATFSRLSSTWSATDASIQNTFKGVNKMAADPANSNRIYAATVTGLRVSDDAGINWYNPVNSGSDINAVCTDVKVGSDGCVLISLNHKIYYSANGGTGSFELKFAPSNVARMELAIAPSDPNYMYCQAAKSDGKLLNIYKSVDRGANWTIIGPGGSNNFAPLGTQGTYDNVIAVYPNNKEKIVTGGQYSMYTYSPTSGWNAISTWIGGELYPLYVHADHHAITFHPTNPNIFYVGSDGGISKTSDGGQTFVTLNKKYNVTQFYTVAYSHEGRVMGGTQDNGTQLIPVTGLNTSQTAIQVKGGDGGYCAFSVLKRGVNFGTTYWGSLCRTDLVGNDLSGNYFFNNRMLGKYWANSTDNIADDDFDDVASFITPIELWESTNDIYSTDSVTFKADRNYNTGEIIIAHSKMEERPLPFTLTNALAKDSSIKVKDVYQSVLAIGMKDAVWLTRTALDFSLSQSLWYQATNIANLGMVSTMAFSKDGNHLYFATSNGIYRISNILHSRSYEQMNADTLTSTCTLTTTKIGDLGTSAIVTSIAVDPSNPDNVIATLGGYGNSLTGKVWYSTNGTTATSATFTDNFTAKDNFVFPVYGSLIVWNDYKKVIIGTEYGMYATDDITAASPVWIDMNDYMGCVPVFQLRQQLLPNDWISGVQNHGHIYAATHGRGIWRTEIYAGPLAINETQVNNILPQLQVYPNPANDNTTVRVELNQKSDVLIQIFDIQGKLVKNLNIKQQGVGTHNYPVSLEGIKAGNYIINAISNSGKSSSKLIVY
ncbi:MAG TPA: hypothetical protein DEH02_01860 [Bacteroidales bacterium]|nr:hypothetical protein [Bacteroidales bacterium]